MRGLVVSALVAVPKGFLKREVTLTFPRHVGTDTKRQQRGSVKVKTDLY